MKIITEKSHDFLQGYLTLVKDKDEESIPISVDDLENALNQNEIIHGIKHETLEQICAKQLFNKKYIVAEATAPKLGESAILKLKIRLKKLNPSEDDKSEDEKVDHYGPKEGFIRYVEKGQLIAIRIPPTRGKHGTNIIGDKMDGVLGKDISLEVIQGHFTKIEGNCLVAGINGIFKRKDNKLHVERIIEIRHDIGLATGSIILPLEADIELIIYGDIKSGFTVQCRTIEVMGTIEDARVNARFLEVRNGIVGKSDLPITADYLTAGFVIGKRNIISRLLIINKEISGGSTIESDFVCAQIIQECTITAKYGIWTKYLYGKNVLLVGVKIKVNDEYNNLLEQLTQVDYELKESARTNSSLLKKAGSITEMAKRMPNNLAINRELTKIKEVYKTNKKNEKLKAALEEEIQKITKNMYILEKPFILIELGFSKATGTKDLRKTVNDLAIKEYTYDKNEPLITGIYTIENKSISVNPNYNIGEINQIIDNYKKSRIDHSEN